MSAGETAKKGCLGILTVFMVGFGSCVGLVTVGQLFQGYHEWQDRRLATSIKHKIETNTATSDELALYSEMLGSYKLREIIEPNLDYKKQRLQLLTQSANQGNVTGKVLLANLLFDMNVLEQKCDVNVGMDNLRYGEFHNYHLRTKNIVRTFSRPLYRMQNLKRYNKYSDLQKSAKVLLLRDAIRCDVSNLVKKDLLVDNVQHPKTNQLVFEFALAEITGNNERINLIKQVNSEQPTDEVMQQANELVKAYREKYK